MSGKKERKIMSDTTEFWKKEGHKHIMPKIGGEFPEGWDVKSYLTELCDGKLVTEIGCGIGRLSPAFPPEHYIGIDISPKVLEIAESKNKNYKYLLHNQGDSYPQADVRLVYTVLLHIDDDCIGDFIENLCQDPATWHTLRVIVGEIMERKWRRPGNPPVFNREANEYITLFEKCGFELESVADKVYERYADPKFDKMTGGLPVYITFLTFRKKDYE